MLKNLSLIPGQCNYWKRLRRVGRHGTLPPIKTLPSALTQKLFPLSFFSFMQNKREMELGLSLGDAATTSKPFGFMEKSTQLTNKVTSGFCMGLSIGTNHTLQEEDEDKDDHKLSNNIDHNSDNTNTRTATVQANKGTILTVDTSTDPPIQLDLLPNTPVPRNQNSILTLASDNGTQNHFFFPLNI